ncbi:MAG: DinB family protein [Caldilineaceae bacterium]
MGTTVAHQLKIHWQQLRGMTYDLLEQLSAEDLVKRLPFSTSQEIQTQFFCMLGTQESWLSVLQQGKMDDWDCSLQPVPFGQAQSIDQLRAHLARADHALFEALDQLDLLQPIADGHTPLHHYMVLVEHEAHHQGQLINFIYALDLPIPRSWADKWALSR